MNINIMNIYIMNIMNIIILSDIIIMYTNIENLTILSYYFKPGLNAT